MKKFYTAYQFLKFIFSVRNLRGNGVHSPFLYDFFQYVIDEQTPFYCFKSIELLRCKLMDNNKILNINDLGTGNAQQQTVSRIARRCLKSPRYAQMLFRAVNFTKSTKVLELGTSFGITTAYLASPDAKINCVSLEGCREIAEIAQQNFQELGIQNIKIDVGNIDNTLSEVLNRLGEIDFVFVDANHRYEATVKYFSAILPCLKESSVLAIDDIYYSKEMTRAWNEICQHPHVSATINLFQMGFVFFNPNLPRQHCKTL